MTTYADLHRALRGLGEGRWITPQQRNSTAESSLSDWAVTTQPTQPTPGRLVWPDDLDIGVTSTWANPTRTEWLAPVATLAQPIYVHITHRGEPLLSLAGYLVWPGWDDTDVDPHRHCTPYVVPVVDEQARVARWEARCLAAAVSWLHGIEALPIDELTEVLGVDVLEDDTLVTAGVVAHPWSEEWLHGDGF